MSKADKEEWRDIIGYEGKYQVSNLGRIKSLCRVVKRKNGHIQTQLANKILEKYNLKNLVGGK